MKAENKVLLFFFMAIWSLLCLSTLGTFLLDIDFFKKTALYNDEGCVRVRDTSLGSSEDQTKFNNNSIIMTEWSIMKHKPGEDRPGAMYVASGFQHSNQTPDAKEFVDTHLTIEKLPLVGFPDGVDFHPHGMYVHKPDNTLYVVNHAYENGGERIEVFDIFTTESNDGGSANELPTELHYKYSITSEWMQKELNGILNSVLVVEPNKFYVTQYEAHAQDREASDFATNMKMLGILFFKPKKTGVLYCEFDPNTAALDCEKVADGFVLANGITSNTDHSKIFVADFVGRSVSVFDRDASTNALTNRITMPSPFVTPDNIKFDDVTGNVYGAGLSNLYQNFKNFALHPGIEKPESTGGLIEISYSSDRGRNELHYKGWSLRNTVNTNKINMATNGIRMNSHYVMGSGIGFNGILVCPLVQDEAGNSQASSQKTEL